jgi:hypothetical protein
MEALGKKLTDDEVFQINQKMKENGYEEFYQIRFEIEDSIEFDIWDGDLFHVNKAINNDTLIFEIEDENKNKVAEFGIELLPSPFDEDGNEVHTGLYLSAIPNVETVPNIWLTIDESKGGCFTYEIESEEVPKPEDFSYSVGSLETPDGDWDFINAIYYKGQKLEVEDLLDSTGKASTVEIYRFDL